MNEVEREQFHMDFERALAFASRLHSPQTRKETDIPYISHLVGVAGLVLENGGDRDQAIAGLLHDAIEDRGVDCPGGVDALRRERRPRIAARDRAATEAALRLRALGGGRQR